MRMKRTGGRVVHSPLSFAFSMEETGGSWIQKYNTVNSEFVPDRTLTPYGLRPHLYITDPDGNVPSGDYATSMINVVWTVTLVSDGKETQLTEGTDYTLKDDHTLLLGSNVTPGNLVRLEFRGDYNNALRNEVSHFTWQKECVTENETSTNLILELQCDSKMNFSPFKTYGDDQQFPIVAVLRNGTADLGDKAAYKWQVFDWDQKAWTDIIPENNLWYVSGKDTGRIIVNVDFIQRVALRVTAWLKTDTSQQESASTLLRRWYGQWEDNYEFAYAQYIFTTTKHAKAVAKVVNRQGNITDPQRYFDIELFYRENADAEWKSLGNGTEKDIDRDKMEGNHELGGICREKSAYVPILLADGTVLTDSDGNPIVGQFPTSEKEFD
ncbi:MAG: hypothetical protein PUF37_05380 [Prevotellaceae bacterium]|nr:hypothetical protein [Prevotellaceae bacterium]